MLDINLWTPQLTHMLMHILPTDVDTQTYIHINEKNASKTGC